ncbi:nucleotidyltransferase domain-containing protein [Dictyobacter aurantiacus]|uniref:Polymerase nucleotidyl transferase domain-containing protein n=1 Tax=Dictyobacter aurantiacus TaxID=1936993 RepID=A0A401ZQK0_9CHLR|nr:nucleotidyltransferase domain-containing protein [Dictyobacter aurantiacus]GCE09139.1 hypothetical protein KDAU_64680 [Dictyobacter aurantiacus]
MKGSTMASAASYLSDAFLQRLVADIDDETVTAIILHGSYARGDAHPPYSDIDIVRITRETPERPQQKQFVWYENSLLNLSSRPLSIYREWLRIPQEAIFRVSTIRDAHILLDKEGTFRAFQDEVSHWTWDPLQADADVYASKILVELSEIILRTLGAIQRNDTTMLVERICLHILPAVMEAVGVQGGILAKGDHYLQQVQEVLGLQSNWTRYYMEAAGVFPCSPFIRQRGIAAIRLYQETVFRLMEHIQPEHQDTINTLLTIIDHALPKKVP